MKITQGSCVGVLYVGKEKAENGVVKMFSEERKTGDNIKVEEIYRTTLTPTQGSCNCNC